MADPFALPTLQEMLDRTSGPSIFTPPPPPKPSILGGGIRAGFNEFQSNVGSTVEALGTATGAAGLRAYGAEVAERNQQEAARYGRPDLEAVPWREGGAPVLPWLGYQAAKQGTLWSSTILGSLLGAAAAPKLGATAAVGGALGAGLGTYATGAGSIFEGAKERGGVDRDDALRALVLGVPYAAAEAITPVALGKTAGLLKRTPVSDALAPAFGITAAKTAKGRIGQVIAGGTVGEALTEGFQTSLELTDRPDLSIADKSRAVIDSMIAGGILGGTFGGVAGATREITRPVTPDITDQDLAASTDAALQPALPAPESTPLLEAPSALELEQPISQVDSATLQTTLEGTSTRVESGNAQPEDLVAFDVLKAEAIQRADDIGQPIPVWVRRAQNVEAQARANVNAQLKELMGRKNVPSGVEGRSMLEAASSVVDRLEQGDDRPGVVALAETLGLMNEQGLTVGERDVELERSQLSEAIREAAETVQAGGPRQVVTRAEKQRTDLLAQRELLDAQVAFADRVEAFRSMDREAMADRILNGEQAAPDVAESGPPIEIAPDRPLLTDQSPDLPTTAAPQDASTETQMGEQLAGLRDRMEVSAQRSQEYDAAEMQRAGQDRQVRAQRAEAEAVFSILNDGRSTVFEQLTPAAQQEFTDRVATGRITDSEFKRLRARRRRMPALKDLQPNELRVVEDATVEPKIDKARDGGYTVTLGSGRQVDIVYKRGTDRGWYIKGLEGNPDGELAVSGGKGTAANQVVRMALNNSIPEGVSRNPVTGARFRMGSEPASNPPPMTDIMSTLTDVFGKRDDITVVATASDLPADIRGQLNETQMARVKGAVDRSGQVYVVGRNAESLAEAVATANHELLGHKGLRARFRQGLDEILVDIYKRNDKMRGAVNNWLAQYGELYGDDQNRIARATEEVLAQVSENGPVGKTIWDQVRAAVRKLLRKISPRLAKNMSDFEVNAILASAHAHASNVDQSVDMGGTRFSFRSDNDFVRPSSPVDIEGDRPSAASAERDLKAMFRYRDQMADQLKKVSPQDAPARLRRLGLYLADLNHIAGHWGTLFETGAVRLYESAHRKRVTAGQRMSALALKPMHMYDDLNRVSPKMAETVRDLMRYSQINVDPRRKVNQQPWLKQQPEQVRDELLSQAKTAHESYKNLTPQAREVYEAFVAVNETLQYADHTMSLYNSMAMGSPRSMELAKSFGDPMVDFLSKRDQLHETPPQAREFWERKRAELLAAVKELNSALRQGPNKADEVETKGMVEVDQLVRNIDKAKAEETAPYFHLGRFGDYAVSFMLAKAPGKGRVADQKALKRVAAYLKEQGYTDVIQPGTQDRGIFIRTETQANAVELHQKLLDYAAQNPEDIMQVRQGGRSEFSAGEGTADANWVRGLLEFVEASSAITEDMDDNEVAIAKRMRAHTSNLIRDYHFARLPDTAIEKLRAHRMDKGGFSDEMVRSFAFRADAAARAMANLSAARQTMDSISKMLVETKNARDLPGDRVHKLHDVVKEILTREEQLPQNELFSSFVDTARAVNHAYFLGMSPAYFLTNLTQVGVLLWPELGKTHGFTKSAKAIAKETGVAFNLMQVALRHAQKNHTGVARIEAIADVQITPEMLEEAGITGRKQDYMMNIVNSGVIDIGSMTREIGRISADKNHQKMDRALRVASVVGLYSEIVTRSAAALATYDLMNSRGASLDQITEKGIFNVNETMFNYSPWSIGRFSGKRGVIGGITPLVMSFQQYNYQLIGKLYREVNKGLFQNDPEARKFLYGHLTAVTALAGTLGLPMVTVLARVADEAGDMLADEGEEPTDVITAYRGWLADVFGDTAGEMIARGPTRALNLDLSVRAGEQNIIPFSRMVADKRGWEEAIKDTSMRMLGSPASMATNWLEGGKQFMEGNYLEGLKTAAPVFLKGPIDTITWTDRGYVDRAGNVLPMTVGANDVISRLMGFNPSELAEYREVKFANTVRNQQLQKQARNLRKQIMVAIESGDTATARDLIAKARAFDSRNPAFDVLDTLSQTMRQRARARAMSDMTGLPIGINPRDPGAIGLDWQRQNF